MAETYSIAKTVAHAHNPYAPTVLTLPDSTAQAGSQRSAMSSGKQVFCKGPDGSFAWYTFDAERSRAGDGLFMLRV